MSDTTLKTSQRLAQPSVETIPDDNDAPHQHSHENIESSFETPGGGIVKHRLSPNQQQPPSPSAVIRASACSPTQQHRQALSEGKAV